MARTVLHRSAHAPSVADWLEASGRHQPLSERTVLELSRRIRCWQEHPDGPEQAPAHVRRRALSARNQLVRHNLKLISHTWSKHRSSLRGEAVPVTELQALISTWWSTVTTELDGSSGEDDGPGLSRLERIAGTSQPVYEGLDHPADSGDEHRALLPSLLGLLSYQERELLSYRYLLETPLSHRQIQQRMGLSKAEQLAMEATALERLRNAARE